MQNHGIESFPGKVTGKDFCDPLTAENGIDQNGGRAAMEVRLINSKCKILLIFRRRAGEMEADFLGCEAAAFFDPKEPRFRKAGRVTVILPPILRGEEKRLRHDNFKYNR